MLFDDFHVPSTVIKSGDNKVLEVRGLSFADISELISNHKPDVDKIMQLWETFDKDSIADGDVYEMITGFAFDLLNDAPIIISTIIAMCADCMDKLDRVARLPLSIQIQSLEAIIQLTADDFGGMVPMLGKIANLVIANVPKAVGEQLSRAQAAMSGFNNSTPA